jgi:hypothetical protein
MKNKILANIIIAALSLMAHPAFAASSSGIGTMAKQVTAQYANIGLMVTGSAYIAGSAFIIGGILKLKAYKDNPQQTALGIPMTMLAAGGLLMYLPSLTQGIGGTFFSNASAIAYSGTTSLAANLTA